MIFDHQIKKKAEKYQCRWMKRKRTRSRSLTRIEVLVKTLLSCCFGLLERIYLDD